MLCDSNDVINWCVFASVIDCGEPPAYYPDSSNYYALRRAGPVTTYGSTWTYVCREGYKNEYYDRVWLWLTCKSDGQWHPYRFICMCT